MANKKTKTKKEVLAIVGIKSPDDIYQTLYRIHMEGRRDDKLAEKLICLLMKQEKWDYGHGMKFYEFILRKYGPPGWELEELLAVSGISEEYGNLPTPAKRRGRYLDNNSSVTKLGDSGMEKHEKTVLERISKDIYHDFCARDSRLLPLCREWILEVGLSPQILEESETSEKRREAKPQGTKVETQKMPSEEKESKNSKKKKRGPKQKKPGIVNIIMPLKVTYVRVTREKPQYGFWTLIGILVVLMLTVFTSNGNSFFGKPQITSISVEESELELMPGEKRDPGISVSPVGADKNDLEYTIGNPALVDITAEWLVVGCRGWKDGADNTTKITLRGGNAENAVIFFRLLSEFQEGADKEVAIEDNETSEWQLYTQ